MFHPYLAFKVNFPFQHQQIAQFVQLDILADLRQTLGKSVLLVLFHSPGMAFALCAPPDSSAPIRRAVRLFALMVTTKTR
jgi:hypothetical protein